MVEGTEALQMELLNKLLIWKWFKWRSMSIVAEIWHCKFCFWFV